MSKEEEVKELRDEFAMAALAGLMACSETVGTHEGFADDAYKYANAMMERRKRS